MSEREKGLGSATGQVERLTVELGRVREEMKQGETASVETRKENTLLKVRNNYMHVHTLQ